MLIQPTDKFTICYPHHNPEITQANISLHPNPSYTRAFTITLNQSKMSRQVASKLDKTLKERSSSSYSFPEKFRQR